MDYEECLENSPPSQYLYRVLIPCENWLDAGTFPTLSDRELRLLERNGRGKDSSLYQMGFVRSEYEEQQILLRLQHDEQLKTLVKQPGNVIDQSSLGMGWAANK